MNKFYFFLTQKQLTLLKRVYKQRKMKIGKAAPVDFVSDSLSHSKSPESALPLEDKPKKLKRSGYGSSQGGVTAGTSLVLAKENSFDQQLHRRRGSTEAFIESESSYVKVDCSNGSSAQNWDSVNRLQSGSVDLGRPEQEPKSQVVATKRQKTKVNYNSRLDLKNSPHRLKDSLNAAIRRIYGDSVPQTQAHDTLYLHLARHSAFYDRSLFLVLLDHMRTEKTALW